jgi:hypothetical protein
MTLGSLLFGRDESSSASPTGLSFAAQPQVFARLVSVGFFNKFKNFISTSPAAETARGFRFRKVILYHEKG